MKYKLQWWIESGLWSYPLIPCERIFCSLDEAEFLLRALSEIAKRPHRTGQTAIVGAIVPV